jgi:hypothetical protein
VEDAARQLAESAPRFAQEALAALSSGDDVGFALYAATSLEHLLKSYLAGKHPALIVDAKSLDSLLHACGQDTVAKTPRDRVKTISATEGLERVSRFLPLLGSHAARLQELFGVRNGAVHLGDSSTVTSFVLPFLKASEQIREALGLDRNAYWGEYVPLADQTLREHVEAAELKAAAAVAAARASFVERFRDLDERARLAAITAMEPDTFAGDEQQPTRCPSCDATAMASGTVETEWRYEEIGDEDFAPYLDATFFPESLRCYVCGLRLENEEELVAAGLARSWDIDVDPEHYYEEPDEDWYRGR